MPWPLAIATLAFVVSGGFGLYLVVRRGRWWIKTTQSAELKLVMFVLGWFLLIISAMFVVVGVVTALRR